VNAQPNVYVYCIPVLFFVSKFGVLILGVGFGLIKISFIIDYFKYGPNTIETIIFGALLAQKCTSRLS
jgi:hypothetical protein